MLATASVASISVLALAGCAADSGSGSEPGTDEDVTLTVTTFGTFGYEDLYKEYEELNPHVTIEASHIHNGGNTRTQAFTQIAAGRRRSDTPASTRGG